MKSTTLMDLASPIFLAVATFRRKAKRGTPITGDEIHDELTQIFREQDQRAEVESTLNDAWQRAKRPLAYLVDEVMTNTEWEYRGWWADNSFETKLLGQPQKMRGITFFDDLELARKDFDDNSKTSGPQRQRAVDLMTIFYCCIRLGFEGKFAGQPQELERESQQLLSVLPSGLRAQTRELFADAYHHTVEIPPKYETYMRLASIVVVVLVLALAFVTFRAALKEDLTGTLEEAVEQVGDFFGASA